MERRPFDMDLARRDRRRKEWVSLDAGDVCVWELTVAESMTLAERSARPAIDPRGGVDRNESILWQILLSCRVGDEEDSPRLFSEQDLQPVFRLRIEEETKLLQAIGRVNGTDSEEVRVMTDFTPAPEAHKHSELLTGV